MISDEDQVRTLLRASHVPPTRLDADLLLARGRRSRRRWRRATVAAAVLAVVAVAVPAVTIAVRLDREPVADGRFARKPRVVHRVVDVAGTLRCESTPLPVPTGQPAGDTVTAADPTGTHVVGGATIWTRAEPTVITVPGNPAEVTAAAVNSGGTVVGHGSGRNWRFADGAVRELPTPPGWDRAVVHHVDGKGDALGLVSGPADRNAAPTALVVWPADRPDSPRIIREPDSQPLAIRDDGTVIAARNRSETDLGAGSIVVHRPNGTRTSIAVPRQLNTRGSMRNVAVHGDYLYSAYADNEITFDDGVTPLGNPYLHPVRWDLRTGVVEVFDDLYGAPVGGPEGWFVAGEDADGKPVLVGRDRVTHRFPVEKAVVRAVAPAGAAAATLAGFVDPTPVTWNCTR